MVNAVTVILDVVVPVSSCVDAPGGMAVDLFLDMLCGELTVVISVALCSIRVYVLLDVNVNVFAGVMLEVTFVMPAPIENFRCLAAFDCLSMAALDCDRVLQAWIPSYHV